MGKTKKQKKVKVYPLISVCTPTYNRRPFIPTMFECFKNQTYPRDRIEWIVVDDGTDKIQDLIDESGIENIKYFPIEEKMTLGAKRNFMHTKSTGSIIVYFDDDDYYPPERISHAVEKLQNNKTALCAGASEMYIYFKHIQKMIQCGPYGERHATAGTFAFRKELLDMTKYNETASLAEEKEFLHGYTIPFVQLDPMKTILVFSHEHNTFDKRRMLENPNPNFVKESDKTVDSFIKSESEVNIKKFFLEEIDEKLKDYEPGEPKMKPDVLKQMAEIDVQRAKLMEERNKQMQEQKNAMENIMVHLPGKEKPEKITLETALMIIKQQSDEIGSLKSRVTEMQNMNENLQQIIQKKK